MNTAIGANRRTPEQDEAYFEARRIADGICRRQDREMSEDEFSTVYLATLNRHMLRALEPVRKAKLQCNLMFADPSMWTPTPELDAYEATIAERYTRGIL